MARGRRHSSVRVWFIRPALPHTGSAVAPLPPSRGWAACYVVTIPRGGECFDGVLVACAAVAIALSLKGVLEGVFGDDPEHEGKRWMWLYSIISGGQAENTYHFGGSR